MLFGHNFVHQVTSGQLFVCLLYFYRNVSIQGYLRGKHKVNIPIQKISIKHLNLT